MNGTTYSGFFVFTHGEIGGIVVIAVRFKGLSDAPADDLIDFVGKTSTKAGRVYKFIGDYTKFPDGRYKLSGRTIKMHIIF